MLAPFLKDAPVCVSGSSSTLLSQATALPPGTALGVGLQPCIGKEKLKEVAEQSWDSLAAVGSPGLIPVSCPECQGCVCPCAGPGEQELPLLLGCCCSSLFPLLPLKVSLFVPVSQVLTAAPESLQLPKGGHGEYSRSPPGSGGWGPLLASRCCLPQPCGVPWAGCLNPSLCCLHRGCALPDGRGAQADPEPAGGDGECPTQHPCQGKMLFCAVSR